jgi:hypothetical protein
LGQTSAALRVHQNGTTLGAFPIGKKPVECARPHLRDELGDFN